MKIRYNSNHNEEIALTI